MSLINKIIQGQGLTGWTYRISSAALDSLRQVGEDKKIERLIRQLEKKAYKTRDKEKKLNELLLGEELDPMTILEELYYNYEPSQESTIQQFGFRGLEQGMTEEDFHSLLNKNKNVEVPGNTPIQSLQEYFRQAMTNLSGYFR